MTEKICFYHLRGIFVLCKYLFDYTGLQCKAKDMAVKTFCIIARRGKSTDIIVVIVTNHLSTGCREWRLAARGLLLFAESLLCTGDFNHPDIYQVNSVLQVSQEDSVLCWWQMTDPRRTSQPNWLANTSRLKLTLKELTLYPSSLNAERKVRKPRDSVLGKITEYVLPLFPNMLQTRKYQKDMNLPKSDQTRPTWLPSTCFEEKWKRVNIMYPEKSFHKGFLTQSLISIPF